MFHGTDLWKPYVDLQIELREYSGRLYEMYQGIPDDLYDAVRTVAKLFSDKICLIDDDGTEVSYRDLIKLTEQFAKYLKAVEGISCGDHVAILLNSSREFVISLLAVIRLGAIAIPMPSKYRQPELLSLLEKSEAKLVICEEKYISWLAPQKKRGRFLICHSGKGIYGFSDYRLEKSIENISYAIDAEAPAVLLFTSGTTSLSKGVVLTNFNIMHAAATYKNLMNLQPEDSTLIAAPIYQVTALFAQLSAFLYAGGTIYLQHTFQTERVLRTLRDERITYLHAAPTIFSLMLKEKDSYPDFPRLRALLSGGSFMAEEKIRAVHAWIPHATFRSVYGMTETASPATLMPYDSVAAAEIGSVGLPVPGLDAKVVDEQGRELPNGQIGEVLLRGTNILSEYYKLKTPLLTEDGWLSTGDIGYFNKKGFLFLVDRKKDMINRGGEKICSYDVENELYRIQEIREAAVVGIPDELYEELPAAAIVFQADCSLTSDEIRERLKERLAKYQIPVRYIFLHELPVTPNGKVNKKEIREMFR